MAKANLALAYEEAGDERRGRMSARQALAIAGAPEAVTVQATAVVERLGSEAGDLIAVIDEEPLDRWPALVREELARWIDSPPGEGREEWAAWIEGQVAHPDRGPQLAEALLGGLLELPPDQMDAAIRALLEALGSRPTDTAGRFRPETARAMAAFQPPQEARLRARFNQIAAELGQDPAWS
jgi:hypothetical protein